MALKPGDPLRASFRRGSYIIPSFRPLFSIYPLDTVDGWIVMMYNLSADWLAGNKNAFLLYLCARANQLNLY